MTRAANLNRAGRQRHAFFSRRGGVSAGVYESLNCGFGSGDSADNVRANRAAAMAQLGASAEALTTVHQIHSANVAKVDAPWSLDARPEADAMVT
ncbi:MAG: laccase domain-containing protein, partial [Rhodospirillaceae bacterium]